MDIPTLIIKKVLLNVNMLKWLGIFFVTIGVVKLIVACTMMISERQKEKGGK